MAETGAVGGVAAQINTNLGQQRKIEEVERDIASQKSKNTTDTTATKNTTENSVKAAPEQVETTTEELGTNSESNVQKQANNLDAANNVAGTSPNQRGQTVNEFA